MSNKEKVKKVTGMVVIPKKEFEKIPVGVSHIHLPSIRYGISGEFSEKEMPVCYHIIPMCKRNLFLAKEGQLLGGISGYVPPKSMDPLSLQKSILAEAKQMFESVTGVSFSYIINIRYLGVLKDDENDAALHVAYRFDFDEISRKDATKKAKTGEWISLEMAKGKKHELANWLSQVVGEL